MIYVVAYAYIACFQKPISLKHNSNHGTSMEILYAFRI